MFYFFPHSEYITPLFQERMLSAEKPTDILIDLSYARGFFFLFLLLKSSVFDFGQSYYNLSWDRSLWAGSVLRIYELHKLGCPNLSPDLGSPQPLFLQISFLAHFRLFSSETPVMYKQFHLMVSHNLHRLLFTLFKFFFLLL